MWLNRISHATRVSKRGVTLLLLLFVLLGLCSSIPFQWPCEIRPPLDRQKERPHVDGFIARAIRNYFAPIPASPIVVTSPNEALEHRYVVIIDAGSTGTRIHVFKFCFWAINATYCAIDSGQSYKVKIPLSRFLISPHGLESTIISPLIQFANTIVPSSMRTATPIALYATAGLRNDFCLTAVQSLMDRLVKHLGTLSYQLANPKENVKVISGQEESTFGWLSVNLLNGNFMQPLPNHPAPTSSGGCTLKQLSLLEKASYQQCHDPLTPNQMQKTSNTSLSMDLGGASTQIAFEIPDNEAQAIESTLSSSPIVRLSIFRRSFTLFSVSYHGFGLDLVRQNVRQLFFDNLAHVDTLDVVTMPCFSPFYSEKIQLKNGQSLTLNGTSQVSYSACRNVIKSLFDMNAYSCSNTPELPCSLQNMPLPKSILGYTSAVAFSAFGDVLHHFFDSLVDITLKDLISLTNLTCYAATSKAPMHPAPTDWFTTYPNTSCMSRLSYERLHEAVLRDHMLCHDMTYLVLLLKHAYHFTNDTRVIVAQKMNNISVTWALGAALLLL